MLAEIKNKKIDELLKSLQLKIGTRIEKRKSELLYEKQNNN